MVQASALTQPSNTHRRNFLVRSMMRLLGENKEFDKLLLEPFSIRAQRRMFRMTNKKTHGPSVIQDLVRPIPCTQLFAQSVC